MTASVLASGGSAAAPAAQRIAARLTGSVWFWAVLVVALFAVPVYRSVTRPLPAAPPVLGDLPAFALTDQQGKPVTAESLRGFVVLAEFVSAARFAEKPTAAAALVRRMRNTGGSVRVVSFVDAPPGTPPWCDAEAARAALPRWIHASGGLAAFEAAARKASGLPDDLPLWGRLLLVDARGRIRRVAVPLKPELDQLMRDTGFLVNMEGR